MAANVIVPPGPGLFITRDGQLHAVAGDVVISFSLTAEQHREFAAAALRAADKLDAEGARPSTEAVMLRHATAAGVN